MLFSVVVAHNQITAYESFDMVHSVVFFTFIPNFIGIVEGFIYANKIQLILNEFDKLFQYLESSMNITVRIVNFIHNFYKKFILILVIHVIIFIIKFYFPPTIFSSYTDNVILFASL